MGQYPFCWESNSDRVDPKMKRYDISDAYGAEESDSGEWVSYVDYRRIEKEARRLKSELRDSGCILDMIREALVSHGVDMEACPPMMYPEAIRNAIVKVVETDRERWIGESRPQVPGEPVYLKTTFEVR